LLAALTPPLRDCLPSSCRCEKDAKPRRR